MNLRTLIVLFTLAFVPAINALNPQPEPPGRMFILTNGIHATVVNDHLMFAQKGGNRPAAAGQYVTRDGLKLVVIKADGQLDAATLKLLKDRPVKAKAP
jgi:hypothetical protein